MESALLGQKQIRHYFKSFSEQHWQRVAKATMMLGIQHVMLQNQKDHLFWDFSKLSVQELEDQVVDNEMYLMQRQRMYKGRQQRSPPGRAQIVMATPEPARVKTGDRVVARPKQEPAPTVNPRQASQERPNEPIIMERPSQQQIQAEASKKVKRVTLVEEEQPKPDIEEDQSSVIPQLSVQGREEPRPAQMQEIIQHANVAPAEKELKITEKVGARGASSDQKGARSTSASRSPTERPLTGTNLRNNPDFARHKSSKAMSQLLKADEALMQKQKRIMTAAKARQPSQKEIANQRVGAHQTPAPGADGQPPAPRVQSRSVGSGSRGRPSSKWRQGVTQEDIDHADEESALNALENQNKRIVYPDWWEGKDELEREEQRRQQLLVEDPRRVYSIANPVKGKVNRNLERFAEDSLDARLRQVKDNAEARAVHDDMIYLQQQHPGFRRQSREREPRMNGQPEAHQNSQQKRRKPAQEQYYQQQTQPIVPYALPQDAYYSQDSIEPSLYSSSARLGPNAALHSSSTKQLNMLDSTGHEPLGRTNGSQSHGSFAYTSNKAAPKYSPARNPRAGASNIPMSYVGPPTRAERDRNRGRGHRDFSNTVSQEEFRREQAQQHQAAAQEEGSLDSRLNRMNEAQPHGSGGRPRRQTEKQPRHAANVDVETQQVYLQQQKEAERNRKRIEEEIRRQQEGSPVPEESMQEQSLEKGAEESRQEQDGGGGMRRFAKGGVAITISASPEQEERERSGSKPKYPFMDLDPFKGNEIPHPDRENSNEAALREQRRSNRRQADAARSQSSVERLYQQRRIPQQYQSVESTLKSRIDRDRRQHLERQRVNQMRQYQDQLGSDSAQEQNETLDGQDSVQPQIFYKKNDSKVIYEEGVDDSFTYPYKQQLEEQMKHQERQRQNFSHAMESVQRKRPQREQRYHQQNQYSQPQPGSYLRRRDVSPHTKEVINSGYYNIADSQTRPSGMQGYPQGQTPQHYPPQDQIELQMQVRQSRDYHNETGFTQKLLGQGSNQTAANPHDRSSYVMSNPSNPSSSHEPGRNGTILSSDQTYGNGAGPEYYRGGYRPPAPPFSNGYYDEQGVYHERGDIGRWQQQMHQQDERGAPGIGPEDSYDATESDENKNNTSRFAFGGPTTEQRYPGDRMYQESRTDPRANDARDPRDGGGVFHGQNNSTIPHNEDSSSLITPNVSYGGKAQLQNQLEQVLMMKSGEFSAGRKQNDTQYRSGGSMVNINEETGVNASHYSQTLGQRPAEQDYRRQGAPAQLGAPVSQNYGNPNFVPPPSKQAPFVIERRGGGRDSGRVSFRNYGDDAQNQGNQFATQPTNYRDQYPVTYQRYNGKDPRYYQDSDEQVSGGDPNRNFNTSQFPNNHDSRPSDQSDPRGAPGLDARSSIGREYKRQSFHQKSNSRSLYGAQPLPEQIAYQQQAFVPQGGNNFTLQRPSRADYIGPDRRMTEPAAAKQNYYVDNAAASGKDTVGSRQESMKEGGARVSDDGAWQSSQAQPGHEVAESFEAQQPPRADGAHLDYRISSGKSLRKAMKREEADAGDGGRGRPLKNYQTFNEEESSQQQPQPPYEGGHQSMEESAAQNRVEIYNQPTETDPADQEEDDEADDMGMEEQMDDDGEMMATSQMSADNTPITHNKGDLDASQNMNEASMVTANLRNFMEEAQPAEGLLNSQSQYGTSSQNNGRRNPGAMAPALEEEQYDLRKKQALSGEPSSRTDEKEGGSNENVGSTSGQWQAANAKSVERANISREKSARASPSLQEDRMYRDMTEESSPDISQTEQTSQILSPEKAGFTHTEGTNDDGDISSSLQETPVSDSKKHTPSHYGTSSRPATSKRDPASSKNRALQSSNYDLQENIKRVTEQAQRLTEQLQHWHGSHSQTKSLLDSASNAADSQMVSPQKEARKQGQTAAAPDSQSDSLSPLRDSEL